MRSVPEKLSNVPRSQSTQAVESKFECMSAWPWQISVAEAGKGVGGTCIVIGLYITKKPVQGRGGCVGNSQVLL